MLASVLNQRVQLQEKFVVQGPLGQTVTWKFVKDMYGRVKPLSAQAKWQYQQLGSVVTHEVILRKGTEFNLGNNRMIWRNKILEPISPPMEIEDSLLIPCAEV